MANLCFFAAGPFCVSHSICLNMACDRAVSIETLHSQSYSTFSFSGVSVFLEKVFVLQKILFVLIVSKTVLVVFRVISDCHIKTCRSFKQRDILKISINIFEKILWWSLFWNENLCEKNRFTVLTLERLGGRVNFVTFNIILRHIFPKFHWISSSCSEDMKKFSVDIS